MILADQILFFFSSLGVFNGFLMSLYFLFFSGSNRIQNTFFGLLLLMLSIRIGKSVLFFFQAPLLPIILQFGLSACLFVGPFLFLYIRSVLRQQPRMQRGDWWHILGWLALVVIVGLLFPYSKRPELWNPEFVQGIYAVWLTYVGASGYLIASAFGKLFFNPGDLSTVQKWLLTVFITNMLICLVFHAALYFGFPSYILGPITFSFVFYGLMVFLVCFPDSKTVINGEKQRYGNKRISTRQATELRENLHRLMTERRLFENPDLKLDALARELSVSPHFLSQFLNDNLGKSFSAFINEHRVAAAGGYLKSEHHFTIEGIGNEVGFRSKSAFYAAFKKVHGMTPRQFAQTHRIRSEL